MENCVKWNSFVAVVFEEMDVVAKIWCFHASTPLFPELRPILTMIPSQHKSNICYFFSYLNELEAVSQLLKYH
jgi:hypothetical protein